MDIANAYETAYRAANRAERVVKTVDGGFNICDPDRQDMFTFVSAEELKAATQRLILLAQ